MGWFRKRMWTDDQLRVAIAATSSFDRAAKYLGVRGSGNSVRIRAKKLGIDTSHFGTVRDHVRRWTDDELRSAVAASFSIAGTIRAIGLVPAGGNYDQVGRRIKELALDTSHFTGMGWNKGLKHSPARITPLEEVLVAGRWTSSHGLKKRLFAAGLKEPRCELCGWAECAADGRIPVELDHVNGDRNDNRIENLRILCPNCHALQPTHRGLNKQSRRSGGAGDGTRTRTPFGRGF